jgi:hypothetical protein
MIDKTKVTDKSDWCTFLICQNTEKITGNDEWVVKLKSGDQSASAQIEFDK